MGISMIQSQDTRDCGTISGQNRAGGKPVHRSVYLAGLLLACAAVHGFATTATADGRLTTQVETVINGPNYKHAHWGILVADLETGETVYEVNSDKLFAPASTTKLYTVAAALDALGADYRFQTPIMRFGEVDSSGQLRGNLV